MFDYDKMEDGLDLAWQKCLLEGNTVEEGKFSQIAAKGLSKLNNLANGNNTQNTTTATQTLVGRYFSDKGKFVKKFEPLIKSLFSDAFDLEKEEANKQIWAALAADTKLMQGIKETVKSQINTAYTALENQQTQQQQQQTQQQQTQQTQQQPQQQQTQQQGPIPV